MASLTIRKFDEKLKRQLRVQAAHHGRSMEEEARQILAEGLQGKRPAAQNLADAIAALVDPVGGIELDIPLRPIERESPRFDNWRDHTDDNVA
jgi:plasmid stability protein